MSRVFALIRFSFVASNRGGSRLTRFLPVEEKAKTLFSPARLERRFETFERICLPSLLAQPGDEFAAVILASELLPEPYRERLVALVSPHRNLRCSFAPPAPFPYEDLWLRQIEESGDLGEIIATVRLDDDDALAASFTKAVTAYLDPVHAGFCVSFPKGLQASLIRGEPRFWESEWPFVGAGLGLISRSDDRRTIYGCGHHHRITETFPTIVDGRSPQYLVTLHGANDSTAPGRTLFGLRLPSFRGAAIDPHRKPPPLTMSLSEARARHRENFPLLAANDWGFLA